jgi:protein kinase C substrate 80K-H
VYAFENYLPPSLRGWVDQKLRDLRVSLIDAGILADTSASAGESKAVTDSRNRLDSARKDLENQQKSKNEHQEDLDRDFGPDGIFRALKGLCISTDSGEYTYEFCFLDKTMQKPKKGGGHTNMGNFVRMETVTVDEDVPPDGKGLGSGERIAMKHENGQHCWNGPNRSTTVILACAEENEVWKIMEEEKCVYRMEVGTPAVCEVKQGGAEAKGRGVRDEL